MSFEPIAIVGQSCIFPGAFTPAEFWQHIRAGADLVAPCPDRRWRVAKRDALSPHGQRRPDTAITDRGGYVDGFANVFDPSGFLIRPGDILPLDEQFQWVLHAGREALRDADIAEAPKKTGAVLGLLGLPTEGLIRYAEAVWFDEPRPDARNRFCTGLPAQMLASALGLDQGAFALDAACASSLVALKLACDSLHEGEADLMLAGSVSRADSLYIQVGFSALGAVSPSGRSRPFHRDADGLLPAEGASFVVLKRLADAVRNEDRIHGVIRGIGIGNDGRGAGLMSPSADGQYRAIRAAYEVSGVDPEQISLLECHATGTQAGDDTEIAGTSRVFDGLKGVAIGSVKSNMGHPMTAAGMAGLLKILGAMRDKVRPATLHVPSTGEQISRLRDSPFRLLAANERWEAAGARVAALSAFGFGGNNAHLIVEEWTGQSVPQSKSRVQANVPIAVVAIGISTGSAPDAPSFARAALLGDAFEQPMRTISLAIEGLGFPPADLAESTPAQCLTLSTVAEALSQTNPLPRRTGVLTSSGIDPEIARLSLRALKRVPESAELDAVSPPLTAAGVIGRLCNIEANRIGSRYDFHGFGFAVFEEERSAARALELACRALRLGEVDAMIAGGCQIVNDRVHRETVADSARQESDAAVYLVLKRLSDAEASGDRVLALVGQVNTQDVASIEDIGSAVLACAHRSLNGNPWIEAGIRSAPASSLFRTAPGTQLLPLLPCSPPRVFTYSAESIAGLIADIRVNRQSSGGEVRLGLVATDEVERKRKLDTAVHALQSGKTRMAVNGICLETAFERGKVGFVFPGAAAALQRAGRSLIHAFPETLANVCERAPEFAAGAAWLFDPRDRRAEPIEKLWATTVLTQCHVHLTRRVLNVHADAAIGMSSGETNALFAFDVWRDGDAFARELHDAGLFTRHLGGSLDVLNGSGWQVWLFSVAPEEMATLAAAEPRLSILALHAPGEYLVAGVPEIFERLSTRMGSNRAQRVDFDLVVHTPDAAPYAAEWRRLHRRETWPPPDGVRFYQMAEARQFEVTSDSVADSLTSQVLTTLDFPRLIEQAWRDGVRVFLEHGPRGACSSWISRILGDRPHAAIPLDLAGVDSLTQTANAVAQLFASGASVDVDAFNARTAPSRPAAGRTVMLPAHFPAIDAKALLPKSAPVQPLATAGLFKAHAAGVVNQWSSYLSVAGSESHGAFLRAAAAGFSSAVGRTRALPARPTQSARVKFTRADLEKTASGRISEVFGAMFEPLDGYERVVRLPMPPMLLADRIISIDAEPGTMKLGSLIAETNIRSDGWYMYRGRMAASIVVESGQADMLLISWLGIDLLVQGQRVYRLLGCDLTWHAELPAAGQTLRYNIRVTGHARQGDIRIFFFEYDCHAGGKLIASVRNGQAGFFTAEELRQSSGIIWKAEPLRTPAAESSRARFPHVPHSYNARQVHAAAAGDAAGCFGNGFEFSSAQQRPPAFANEKLLMIDRVAELRFDGGEWGRGYLRAEYDLKPDHWVFECHFKDDPCFPGTLMLEGAIQSMSFYLMAMGFTFERDGWRFEPVPGQVYPLRCRGQATPESRLMVCEVFVEEVVDGDEPTLYAQVVGSVDGLKCFACTGMAVRLTPGNPLDESMAIPPEQRNVAVVNGVRLDSNALTACANGLPSQAFGEPYARFDKYRRCPRLPSPPYHFLQRITEISGDFGVAKAGAAVTAECDLTACSWYFPQHSSRGLAFAALVETGLQPCGWISCFTGVPLRSAEDLYFRNLDGSARFLAPVPDHDCTVSTRAVLTNIATSGRITLTSFKVIVSLGAQNVLEMSTTFGFFERQELAQQAGLSVTSVERERFEASSDFHVDLSARPSLYFDGALQMPAGDLLMIDRVTGMWDGRVRAEKDVRASEWFFKAHFYGDPVQPGSLGIQAIIQTAEFYAIHNELSAGLRDPQFELTGDMVWKYRGQVLPSNICVSTEVSIRDVKKSAGQVDIEAEGWLWVDGLRIYHVPRFTLRIRGRAV